MELLSSDLPPSQLHPTMSLPLAVSIQQGLFNLVWTKCLCARRHRIQEAIDSK
jgi:hypothetical protein